MTCSKEFRENRGPGIRMDVTISIYIWYIRSANFVIYLDRFYAFLTNKSWRFFYAFLKLGYEKYLHWCEGSGNHPW